MEFQNFYTRIMIISLGREQFIKIENYKENLKINIFDIIEKKKK